MRRKYTKEQRRAAMSKMANETRDNADKMARMYGGCDDPMWPPFTANRTGYYNNWLEFVDVVARPICESEDDAVIQDAMKMFRQECPSFICCCLVMAANRVEAEEAS